MSRAGRGKLRIGDDWNAITIIALSQTNPLKAVAEFVENSIDAGASHIEIIRGRERGQAYLRIRDDGQGVARDDAGVPNFKYVATHICDSIKRRLKADGVEGLQGEFGIGLLSFWTVGEELLMRSPSAEGKTYEMRMAKGDPSFTVTPRRVLFAETGTEITIKPLLSGLRNFSGEKIQWYLASELRDRIRQSGVRIRVTDRHARRQYVVEPRKFDGRLLHELPVPDGHKDTLYLELYLTNPDSRNAVGLYRSGTRVLESITELEAFAREPWTSPYLQGIVDAAKLNLTPGTRQGVIRDEQLAALVDAVRPVETAIAAELEAQRRAEEEKASRTILRTITRAFREALIALPAEEYGWFDLQRTTPRVHSERGTRTTHPPRDGGTEQPPAEPGEIVSAQPVSDNLANDAGGPPQKQFFEYTGPLANVRISPMSSVVRVGESRTLRAIARDKQHRHIEREVSYQWRLIEGQGELQNTDSEIVTFNAPAEPGLVGVGLVATEGEQICSAEAIITVTETLIEGESSGDASHKQGLPAYSFHHATGELWRSQYDADRDLILINSGHRDFVYASRTKALKLRYICRLYAKELVLRNFPGLRPDQLLERMLEVSLYTEEHLR